jgi:hypothetical protein
MYLPDFFTVYISGSGMILPKHRTITSDNTADNFGDAYNAVVLQAFDDGHKDILVCNDDVVLTPYTWPTLARRPQDHPRRRTVVGLLHGLTTREDTRTSGSGTKAIETVYAMLPRHPLLRWM